MELFDKAYEDLAMTEQAEFIDLVAQAVIDKLEERAQLNTMVEDVIARVRDLQWQERGESSPTATGTYSNSPLPTGN